MDKDRKERDGILLKNYCDKCDKTTWHQYVEYKKDKKDPNKRIKIDSYYKCEVCGNIRLLKDWKIKRKTWKKEIKRSMNENKSNDS